MKFVRNSRSERRTAADIRADRDKVDLVGLAARVAAIELERRQLLLSGTDAQVEENSRELAAARLQVERADTLLDELTRLASEAEAREAAAALEAEYAAATAAKVTLDKAIAEAEAVAATLKAHFAEATAAAKTIATWNSKVSPVPVGQIDRRVPYASPESAKVRIMGMIR